MRAFATTTQTTTEKAPAHRFSHGHSGGVPELDNSAPVPFFSEHMIQRKASCACDGGCPNCQSRLPIQAKLKIGAPDDKYEQEADRIADQVMAMPQPTVQRASICPECEEEQNEYIQTTPLADQVTPLVQRQVEPEIEEEEDELQIQLKVERAFGVTSAMGASMQSLQSGGQPLSRSARSFYEPRFRADFSRVRVHSDSHAADVARSVHARALTLGRHVVFGAGEYQPEVTEGKRLVAHELTHVLQQNMNPKGAFLQFYHHDSSCTPDNLRDVVWPADARMRLMVAKAIRVLSAAPIDPTVTALFPKYFMTARPRVATILAVFSAIQAVIDADDYTYECEDDCDDEAAYVRHRLRYIGIDPNIHLCTNFMDGYTLNCNGSLVLHEMTHYAAHLDDEEPACGACSIGGCPVSLSPDDALDNSYSYANFAYELYPLPV